MEFLGKIGWETGVDDSGALRGLAALEAEIRAVMADIERMDATVDIKADITEVEHRLRTAERELTDFTREHKRLLAQQEAAAARGWHAEAQRLEEEEGALRDVIKAHQDYIEDLGNERRALNQSLKDHARLSTELEKKRKLMERLNSAGKRVEAQMHKEQVQVEKLRSTYQKMRLELRGLTSGRKRFEVFQSDADVQRVRTLNASLAQLGSQIRTLGSDTADLDDDTDNSTNSFARMVSAMADTRVHLGFLSLSLKGLAIGLATLGPIILNVVGALGALIGVMGGGILAAAGMAATGFTAVGLGMFGIVQAMGPMTTDIGLARDAFNALSEAEAEFGKNSKEAKEAAKELDKVLKQVGPRAEEVAKGLDKLESGFEQRTGAARRSIADLMVMGLERANALMPDFAEQTNRMAEGFERAGEAFLDAFDEDEMRSTMNAIMGNFSKILPELGTGLGNVFEGLANIMAEFSTHFEGMADGFVSWSEGFVTATQDAEGLGDTIDRLILSAKQFGDFLSSAGSLIATFFGLGQDAGGSLMDDMSNKMDEWTNAMKEDPSGVQDFFEEATDTARDLWQVLGPLADTFLDVAKAMQPVTEGLLAIAEAFAKVVNLITSNPLGSMMMTGIGAFMGGRMLFSAGSKIKGALSGATTAMMGWGGAAQKATPKTAAVGKQMTLFGSNATKTAASTGSAVGKLGALGGAAASTGSMFLRGAGMVARFLGPVGMVASVGFIAADMLGLFGDSAEDLDARLAEANGAMGEMTAQLNAQKPAALQARGAIASLGDELSRSGARGKAASTQMRAALLPMKQAAEEAKTAVEDVWAAGGQESFSRMFENVDYEHAEEAIASLDKMQASILKNGELTDSWRAKLQEWGVEADEIDEFEASISKMPGLIDAANGATRRWVGEMVNFKRAKEGLEGLGQAARSAMGDLLKSGISEKKVIEFGVKFDDRQAQTQATQLAAKVAKLGGKEAVIRIMASDKNAAQTIAALERKKNQLKNPVQFAVKAATKLAEGAIRKVDQIANDVEKPRTVPIREQGGDETKRTLDSINSMELQEKMVPIDGDRGPFDSVIAGIVGTIVGTAFIALKGIGGPGGRTGGTLTSRGPAAVNDPVPGFATGGGYVTKPMFVVGEEAPTHPEFIIATNPAYRTENLGYLMAAASMLGVPGFAGGGQHGGGNDQSNKEKAKKAKEKKRKAKEKKLAAEDKAIAKEDAEIAYNQTRMDWASTQNSPRLFDAARAAMIGDMRDLLLLLAGARDRAPRESQRWTEMQERIVRTNIAIEEAKRAQMGTEFMLTPAETKRLAEIEAQQSLAALTPTFQDDQFYNQRLIGFWENVLERLQSENAGPGAIKEAADALLAARGGGSGGGGGGTFTSQTDAYNSARLDLYRAFGGNTDWQTAPSATAPSGSGGVAITNNFTEPPPDPHTWSEQMAFEARSL